MELSKRLQAIASFVTKGNSVADIGTDHGYIPIYLVKEAICPNAFAMDVNQGPLDKAISNVKSEGLEDKITCIKSNGLEHMPKEGVDTVVIAGMGGDLVEQILAQGKELLGNVKELVLSPQSHPEKVRLFLHNSGFYIASETMLKEDGKYYLIVHAKKGIEKYNKDYFYYYGKKLLEDKNEITKEYLHLEKDSIDKILKSFEGKELSSVEKRKTELNKQKKNILEALAYYEM